MIGLVGGIIHKYTLGSHDTLGIHLVVKADDVIFLK